MLSPRRLAATAAPLAALALGALALLLLADLITFGAAATAVAFLAVLAALALEETAEGGVTIARLDRTAALSRAALVAGPGDHPGRPDRRPVRAGPAWTGRAGASPAARPSA
ncbi:hypothetical protein [Nonomuraea candida]|uniref:hypothetical protein n=1 Tax=Nonomuraea candida TaxID=359159 RepID=UPI0005BD52B0|nr:hypothetical protein [Nonomuraea candida]